jgi:enoyl-CoA hydratase/carnithine racemase
MLALDGTVERIVGVLHDVVEDGGSEWTLERLTAEGFTPEVIYALRLVTKRPEDKGDDLDTYLRFVRRTLANPVARRVKIADIRDNLDLTRMQAVTERDATRINKYLAALRLLSEQRDG